MLDPLQFGIPGGTELVVAFLIFFLLLGIPATVGYWVSQDAKRRGSDHHIAWGGMAFLTGLAYIAPILIFLVFYLIVRDDIGNPDRSSDHR